MFQCGFYETDITPKLGLCIPGYFNGRHSTGIKDPLYAKAVVMTDGKTKIAMVEVDAISLHKEFADIIRQSIAQKLRIEKKCVMAAATHSHTGGPVWGWGEYVKKDDAYIKFMINRAIDAAVLADKNLEDAKIGFGKGYETSISFNRNYIMKNGSFSTNPGIKNPEAAAHYGPIDPEVSVLRVDFANGRPMGALINFACHLDTVDGTEICADYPGEMTKVLRKIYGESFVPVFITGFCGNINHWDVLGETDFDTKAPLHYQTMGRILAGEVCKSFETIKTNSCIYLNGSEETFEIKLRTVDDEEYQKALDEYSNIKEDLDALTGFDPIQINRFYANQIKEIYENNKSKQQAVVQVLKIGETAVYGLSGEIFTEFGLAIKEKSPFKNNICAYLANGNNGYIMTKEMFSSGIYESRLCENSLSMPDTGDIMTQKALKLAKKLTQ